MSGWSSHSTPPNRQPSAHLQEPAYGQDPKASFDDLIDEYATPYGANSRYSSYNISPQIQPGEQHRRGQSGSISHKLHFAQKESKDMINDHVAVGYPPPPVKDSEPLSVWKKLIPDSLACRLYVMTVLIETVIDIAIEGELLVRVQKQNENSDTLDMTSRKMSVYLSIFALAHVFQLVMAVDAVYARNTLQFICLTIFNALFLIYAIIQIKEVQEAVAAGSKGISDIPINVLTTIIPCVIGAAELAYIALGWKIYNEFGWQVYKFLGADRRIKKMYANYQIYECLVKFDVFFWAGFSVQFIWLVLSNSDWEYYVTIAALPLSLVLLVEGHLAARHENKWMMATFMSGCVGAMVYFVYKLVKVLMYKDTDYFGIWKSLSVFSVISIMLLLITFIFSVMLLLNFGRGLKDSLTRKATMHSKKWSQNPNYRAGSQNPNRMSID